MKKYFAYAVGSGNSGVVTKEGAHKWASTILAQNKIDKVFIGEVIEIAERTEPSIKTTQFFCELDEPVKPEAKAA